MVRVAGIDEVSDHLCRRNKLAQQLKPLCCEFIVHLAHTREIGGACRRNAPSRCNHINLTANQISSERRQSIIAAIRPAKFDIGVLPYCITSVRYI